MSSPWSNVADAYDRSFAHLCAEAVPHLLDAVGPPGRLLDVGSGTGTLARAAGARGHTVTACEPEPDLLAMTAARAPGAVTVGAGLPDLPFPDDGFDAATASFVVNHLPDPRAGVAELQRVLRPGGRLAVTIWPPGVTRQAELFQVVLDASGALAPPSTRLDPALDFERTESGLAALLEQGGWTDVTTTSLTWTWRPSPDDFWAGVEGGVGGYGLAWQAQTPAVRDRMRAAYDEVADDYTVDGLLDLPATAVLGVANAYDGRS